ncbi:MAG: hypothetical protein AABX25_02110 [Nanoarchaeota archaeon]
MEVYEPSGHHISIAREMLREQYGFCPLRTTMRKYWRLLGYTPFIPSGMHIGENDKRYTGQNEDPAVMARVMRAYNARKENWGIDNIGQLARELGLPIATVRRAIKKSKEQELQKGATLEARVRQSL